MRATREMRPATAYYAATRKPATHREGVPFHVPQKLTPEQQALAAKFRFMVPWAVNKWFSRLPEYVKDELASAGAVALVEAAERFDPSRGVLFYTFAASWLWGRMQAELKRCAAGLARQTSAMDDGDGEFVANVLTAPDEFARATDAEHAARVAARVAAAVADLPDAMRVVLTRRYGLGGEPPRTLSEIGAEMGLTKEMVRQIQRQAKAKLAGAITGLRTI